MAVTNLDSRQARPPFRLLPVLIAFTSFSVTAPSVSAQQVSATLIEDDTGQLPSLFGSDEVPEVLSTTRLRQPKSRVPGTTTVIDGALIRDLGIMSLVEVFRLVPGMTVGEVGSHQPVATYHGTSHYEQRRMQVLIDGRTAFRPTLADMEWNSMPVPLELIDRIEIARGPNAAAYGLNAFLGTINIITRTPADSSGTELRAVSGSRGYLRTFASTAESSNDYDWRLAWEHREFDGFDVQERPPDYRHVNFNDGHEFNTFLYDSTARFNDTFSLNLSTGVIDGVDQQDRYKSGELGAQTDPNVDVRDYHIQTRLNGRQSENHFYHLQLSYERFNRRQRWTACLPESSLETIEQGIYIDYDDIDDLINPVDCSQSPEGVDPVYARANEDQQDSRLDLELQKTLILNPGLKLVGGFGHRKDSYESETFFNGRGHVYQSRVFGHAEYSPSRWLTFNAGANWEKTSTTDEHYLSPRLAANVSPIPNHTLRLVYSEAVRTPDEFEQNPDYSYRLSNVRPEDARWEGFRIRNTNIWDNPELETLGKKLEEERITSREISYFGQFRFVHALLSVEVRYFNDEMRDMISGVIQFDDWTLDNNVALDQKGVELEASLEFPRTHLRMSYAYIDQEGWYTGPADYDEDEKQYNVELLRRMTVRHSGSLAWIQDWTWGLKSATTVYLTSKFERMQQEFQRVDLRLAKAFFGQNANYEVALTMQHYINDEPTLSSDNIIRNRNQYFLEGSVQF
jgi:iron complex outermembrane receptor protein